MLVQVLTDKLSSQQRQPHYSNLYQKLVETFQRAKQPMPKLAKTAKPKPDAVLRQQQAQLEAMLRESQPRPFKQEEPAVVERRQRRDEKIEELRDRRVLDEVLRRQRQSEAKRNEQHEKVRRHFMRQAAEVERQRMRLQREAAQRASREVRDRGERIVSKIEGLFNNRVSLLKEQLEEERYERRVAQQAQIETMAALNRDLKEQRRALVQ